MVGRQARGAMRSRWAALGAAVAVTFGAGGFGLAQASGGGNDDVTVTIEPERILDTRVELGLTGAFAPNSPRDVQVTGNIPVALPNGGFSTRTIVPADASAVIVNVTVTEPTDVGFLSLRPAGAVGIPSTSTVNFAPGTTEPNSATVALSGGALQVWVFMPTPSARAHVLIDVVGYTVGHDHDDRYYTKQDVFSKAESYDQAHIDTALAAKANTSDVYTKWETYSMDTVNEMIISRAAASEVYSKVESDGRYATNHIAVNESFVVTDWAVDEVVLFEAQCPTGSSPTGGGAAAGDDGLALDSTYPIPEFSVSPTGWAAFYRNVSGAPIPSITVYVHILCAHIP